MPTYTVLLPDGTTRTIDGPEGSTQAQAETEVYRQLGIERGSNVLGALNTIGSGATLGWSDEFGGLVGALPALLPGGESPQEAYTRHRDAIRASQNRFATRNPLTSLGLEAIGGLATGGYGGMRAGAVPLIQAMSPTVRALTGSAAAGATAGAGMAPGMAEVPGETLKGAAVGAAMAPVAAVAGRALTATGRGMERLWRGFSEGADPRAQRLVREIMNETGVTREEFGRQMRDLGPDAIVADLNEATKRKLSALAAEDPAIDVAARQALDARAAQANPRLIAAAQEGMGVPAVRFGTRLQEIDKQRRAAARAQYSPIYETLIPQTEALQKLLKRPSAKEGYAKALRLADDAGEPLPRFLDKKGKLVETPTLGTLDQVKQGIDAVIEANTNEFGRVNATGRAAALVKRDLLKYIEDSNPELGEAYKQARSTYAGFSAMQDALKRGQSIFREDADILADDLAGMGESEREAFRIGAFNAVRDEVEAVRETGTAATRAKFDTEKYRRRLRLAFDSDEKFEGFLRALRRERTYSSTRRVVEGGSPTAKRQADLARQQLEIGSEILHPEASASARALNALQTAWQEGAPQQGFPHQVRGAMANLLMNPNLPPAAIRTPSSPLPLSSYGAAAGAGAAMYNPTFIEGLLGQEPRY